MEYAAFSNMKGFGCGWNWWSKDIVSWVPSLGKLWFPIPHLSIATYRIFIILLNYVTTRYWSLKLAFCQYGIILCSQFLILWFKNTSYLLADSKCDRWFK